MTTLTDPVLIMLVQQLVEDDRNLALADWRMRVARDDVDAAIVRREKTAKKLRRHGYDGPEVKEDRT